MLRCCGMCPGIRILDGLPLRKEVGISMKNLAKEERRMRALSSVVLLPLLGLVGAACTQSQPTPTCTSTRLPAPTLDLTYTDINYGFSVRVPADWDTSPVEGFAFDAADPTYIADFNIVVEDLANIQPPPSPRTSISL